MWWNRRIPGFRWFLYGAGLAGLFRTAERSLDEAGAPTETIDPTTRAEGQDVHAKAVLLAGIGLLLGIWAIVLLIYPLFNYYSYERTGGRTPSKVLAYLPKLPPRPRNESNPHVDLKVFLARQESALSSYRWVDPGKGIVSIPIGRAMQLVAQRGIPPSQPGGKEYHSPSAGTKVTGFEGKVEPSPR